MNYEADWLLWLYQLVPGLTPKNAMVDASLNSTILPNGLESYWMPMTPTHQFKASSRILFSAKGMHHRTDNRSAGLMEPYVCGVVRTNAMRIAMSPEASVAVVDTPLPRLHDLDLQCVLI